MMNYLDSRDATCWDCKNDLVITQGVFFLFFFFVFCEVKGRLYIASNAKGRPG